MCYFFQIELRYQEIANTYCSPKTNTRWESLSEAKVHCDESKECQMITKGCGGGLPRFTWAYCSSNAKIKSSLCGSTLYKTTGKRLNFFGRRKIDYIHIIMPLVILLHILIFLGTIYRLCYG